MMAMKKDSFTVGRGNVFKDLGLKNPEIRVKDDALSGKAQGRSERKSRPS